MTNEDKSTDIAVGCLTLIGLVFLMFITPFLNFALGVIIGWIIKVTIGNLFIKGIGMIGITLAKADIPIFCGTLGIIGSFFKTNDFSSTLQED
jgi:hypothetical protein